MSPCSNADYGSLADVTPSHTSHRSRPLFLALYNAVSANRSSLAGSIVCVGNVATPQERVMRPSG